MVIEQVLSTKSEILNTHKKENLVLSSLDIKHRVTFIVEGVGSDKWVPWYCKAYWKLGEEKLFTLVSMAKTGKNPQTLFSHLLKQEMNR